MVRRAIPLVVFLVAVFFIPVILSGRFSSDDRYKPLDQIIALSRSLHKVRIGIAELETVERLSIGHRLKERGLLLLKAYSQSSIRDVLPAFYWCLHDRIDCGRVEDVIRFYQVSGKALLSRNSIHTGNCDHLSDWSIITEIPHYGVQSLVLGTKGQACSLLTTWTSILKAFPDLKSVEINEPSLEIIETLPKKIGMVSLRAKHLNSRIVDLLSEKHHIRYLKLSTSDVSGKLLSAFNGLSLLKRLWIKGGGFGYGSLRGLDLPHLRTLVIGPGADISLSDINDLERLHLNRLVIYSDDLSYSNVKNVVKKFEIPPKSVVVKSFRISIPGMAELPSKFGDMMIQNLKNIEEW
jgi:hypothetical protein